MGNKLSWVVCLVALLCCAGNVSAASGMAGVKLKETFKSTPTKVKFSGEGGSFTEIFDVQTGSAKYDVTLALAEGAGGAAITADDSFGFFAGAAGFFAPLSSDINAKFGAKGKAKLVAPMTAFDFNENAKEFKGVIVTLKWDETTLKAKITVKAPKNGYGAFSNDNNIAAEARARNAESFAFETQTTASGTFDSGVDFGNSSGSFTGSFSGNIKTKESTSNINGEPLTVTSTSVTISGEAN